MTDPVMTAVAVDEDTVTPAQLLFAEAGIPVVEGVDEAYEYTREDNIASSPFGETDPDKAERPEPGR